MSTFAPVLAVSGEDLATFSDGDKPIVYLILLTSLVALGFAALFAKEVLPFVHGLEVKEPKVRSSAGV